LEKTLDFVASTWIAAFGKLHLHVQFGRTLFEMRARKIAPMIGREFRRNPMHRLARIPFAQDRLPQSQRRVQGRRREPREPIALHHQPVIIENDGEPGPGREAEELVALLPDLIKKYEKLDILAGSAGCIASLLSLYAMMTGLAGIGYQLLRLAEPEQVPSVLLLKPPVTINAREAKGIRF
jgi:hypothetical protein